MKATVMTEHLKEGLRITERAIAKTPSLPVLQNVHVVLTRTRARVAATDLQMGITCEFPATNTQEGSSVLAPRFLSPLVGLLQEQHSTLEGEERSLVFRSGTFETTLQCVDPEEFPIIPSVQEGAVEITIGAEELCSGLGQVVGMVGQSQARPEIGGVLFSLQDNMLSLVATDSFRLAVKNMVLEKQEGQGQRFILPQRTAREVLGIFSDRAGEIRIFFSPAQAVFDYTSQKEGALSHIQIVSRVLEGEYPDYQGVIPKGHKTKVVVPREGLISHVKAAGIFAARTHEITLSVAQGKAGITFGAQNNESGQHQSFLEAEIAGEEVHVGFNWRFLLEGILQIKAPHVELLLNGEDGPALLRAPGEGGYAYVIMPIKA